MPRILFICDNPIVTVQVLTILGQHDYTVETVLTEAEALLRMASGVPDLLVHHLPRSSFVWDKALWRALRGNPRLANLPMLLIIANARLSLEHEANPYLTTAITESFHPKQLSFMAEHMILKAAYAGDPATDAGT